MRLRHSISRVFWAVFALLAVATALFITTARLLFPNVDEYRSDVEGWVAQIVGHPVAIGALDAQWRGLEPELIFKEVQILDQQAGQVLLTLEELRLRLDPLSSLFHRSVEFSHLAVTVPTLSLLHRVDGSTTLSGFSPTGDAAASEQGPAAVLWLFQQGRVGVDVRQLLWVDERDGSRRQFNDVHLRLHNHGRRHQVEGMVRLAKTPGESLHVIMDVEGDLLAPGGWSGQVYAKGSALQLGQFLGGQRWRELAVADGITDFELWSDWQQAVPVRIAGYLVGNGVSLQGGGEQTQQINLERLSGGFSWQREEQGWGLTVRDLSLAMEGAAWPDNRLKLHYRSATEQRAPALEMQVGVVRLQDIHRLAMLSPELVQQIPEIVHGVQPRGDLRDLHLSYDGAKSEQARLTVHSRLDNVATRQWQRLPGLEGISGTLSLSGSRGRLELAGGPGVLRKDDLFRDTLRWERLTGGIDWSGDEQGWRLHADRIDLANRDITVAGSLDMLFPASPGMPHLDITLGFRDGDGRQTSRYLPVGIMSENVVAWLDQGILDARVTEGGMILHGPTRGFPYHDAEGRFEVMFHADQAVLSPATGWPQIEDISADVRFFARSMAIEASAGRIYDSRLSEVAIAIEDMRAHPALLTIDGNVDGTTADKLRYLINSPLHDRFAIFEELFESQGDSQLELSLALGLASDAEHHTRGQLSFTDNTLRFKAVDLEISDISGALSFADGDLQADKISGQLLKQPVLTTVHTVQQKRGGVILVKSSGNLTAEGLGRHLPPALQTQFTGVAPWLAEVYIPQQRATGKAVAELRVESNLQGMAIDLPQPLGKPLPDTRKLVTRTEFHSAAPALMIVDYGEQVNGVFELTAVPGGAELTRGELRLGGETAVLPARDGIAVVGQLPAFSLSEWRGKLSGEAETSQSARGESALLSAVNKLELQLDRLEVLGQRYQQGVTISAARLGDEWVADVASPEIKGRIFLPDSGVSRPLVMELEHWYMSAAADDADSTPQQAADPREMPSLKISSKHFSYGGMQLGALELTTYTTAQGVNIQRLDLTTQATTINANGQWWATAAGSITRLDARVDTKDAGRTLSDLGYSDSVRKGEGYVKLHAEWPGGPGQFSRSRLNGTFDMDLRNGRLVDIEPGAGRVFGLLSLQTMPRRLSLDFSDLFSSGLSFDRFKGVFDISDGRAVTKECYLESPSADMVVIGTVDLGTKTYDQRAIVTPHVTENLPLLGALAVSPQVGAALLFMQRVLKKQIDKITTYEYSITGPWDKPEVIKIEYETKAPAQELGQ